MYTNWFRPDKKSDLAEAAQRAAQLEQKIEAIHRAFDALPDVVL